MNIYFSQVFLDFLNPDNVSSDIYWSPLRLYKYFSSLTIPQLDFPGIPPSKKRTFLLYLSFLQLFHMSLLR